VVSTAIGVEGLPVVPGEHYLAADSPKAFSEAILLLLADSALREKLARAARQMLALNLSWSRVGRQFEEICLAICRQHAELGQPGRRVGPPCGTAVSEDLDRCGDF